MSASHRIDVHQHVVPPFWANELPAHGDRLGRLRGIRPEKRHDERCPPREIDRSRSEQPRLSEKWEQRRDGGICPSSDLHIRPAIDNAVEIFPSDIVKRRAFAWDGLAIEVLEAMRRGPIEFRYRGPCHLLVVYERGGRRSGETRVEGLPPSMLRDVQGRLTFVPAGCEFREWQGSRTLSGATYFYFDRSKMPVHMPTAPRLFFKDPALWQTAIKLVSSVHSGSDNERYCEALGVVLAHELGRLNGKCRIHPSARGGLAGWQQRTATNYVEEHLAEQIPVATLAQLVRLSRYHFCRAFKQSIGISPHRYHNHRRIERAKTLLAKPGVSVTKIALTLGFSGTSSFTTTFRKMTGSTPTDYRRSAC